MSTKAVVLAGGLGTRLAPFTQVIPKPLLPIGEKSVLEIQLSRLKKCGFSDVYLCTNYKSDYIEKFFGSGSRYGINLKISKEEYPLGTAGPITLIKDQLSDPFILMNGDILSSIDFRKMYEFAISQSSNLTIGIKKHITPFAFGDIFFEGNFVTGIDEKPDIVKHILAGIYVLKPEIFDFIPMNKYFGMDELIKNLLKANESVTKYEIQEYWLDIGQIDDFKEAQTIFDKHFKES